MLAPGQDGRNPPKTVTKGLDDAKSTQVQAHFEGGELKEEEEKKGGKQQRRVPR